MIERVYRLLLRLVPRDFRRRFGEELIATARDVERERGRGMRATALALGDALSTAIRLHADGRDTLPEPEPLTWIRSMELLIQDLQFAVRALRRDPLFTVFATLTLALGIGANAAMFGIADRLLIRGPEHVREPARVVRAYLTEQPTGMPEFTTAGVGNVTFDVVRERSHVADGVAAYTINLRTLGAGADARTIHVGYTSASFFPLVAVQPALGRFFNAAEDAALGAEHVVVLGSRLWRTQFGAARDVIGRGITINDETFTVIGVAPAGFTGVELGPVDAWAPINLIGPRVTSDWRTTWSAQWLHVILRLKPGVSVKQAGADLTAAHRAAYNGGQQSTAAARMTVASLGANDAGVEPADVTVVRWLAAVAVVVLLIAGANVINLLVARGVRRAREIAIRAALGASRARLVRLMVIESMLLAITGGAVGIGLAYIVGGAARTLLLKGVEWTSSPVDVRVLGAALAITILTGLVVGLIPALRVSDARLGTALKSSVRDGGARHARLRFTLTVAQAALSVALLIGAGLFVRSLWNVRTLHLGIEADRVLTAEVQRPSLARMPNGSAKDAERARRRGFYARALERLRQLPQVQRAAIAAGLPFGNRFTLRLRVPGVDSIPRLPSGGPSISAVSDGYFETVGTKILAGRSFTLGDVAGSERVAIVSNLMARTIWPGRSAIGACIQPFADSVPCARVVGIAEDTYRAELRESPPMQYYIPLGQEIGFGGAVLLVRGAGAPTALAGSIRRALVAMDAGITFVDTKTIQDAIDPQIRPWQLGATVFAFTGVLALLVAAIGIYSVTSYLVTQRTHEIGIRIALGAGASQVIGLVVRGAVGMALTGVALGVGIAAACGKLIQPLLFNESARDPVILGGVACVLAAVALVASVVPAARANRIDPLDALRAE
jgi:predicted permease